VAKKEKRGKGKILRGQNQHPGKKKRSTGVERGGVFADSRNLFSSPWGLPCFYSREKKTKDENPTVKRGTRTNRNHKGQKKVFCAGKGRGAGERNKRAGLRLKGRQAKEWKKIKPQKFRG